MRKHVWLLLALPVLLGSCRHFFGKRVRGNGVVKTEERTIAGFRNVDVAGALSVYISQGDIKPIKIEGDENLLPYIEVYKDGDWVRIKPRSGYNLEPNTDLKIYVTAPVYNNIEVSGASDITGQGKIANPENLKLNASGASEIHLEVDAPQLKADVSGSSSIELKGQTRDVDLSLSGASHAHCYDLLAENASVGVSGASGAEVYASVKLDADASGASNISYKGKASNVNQRASGASSVSKAE